MGCIWKFIKALLGLALLAAVLTLCFLGWQGWRLYRETMEERPLVQTVQQARSIENYTTYEQLPPTYIQAVVAMEDERFLQHPGVDPISLFRALMTDLKQGEWAEGGSTLSQQLAKNLFYTQDKKLTRKIAEALTALELERAYDKDEIFELYVNSIYFGNGWYCVWDAAQGYYGLEPGALSDWQCTELACYPNAPSVFMEEENAAALEERRQLVVDKMLSCGYLSQDQAAALR